MNEIAREGRIKYHPLCAKIGLTHLSFVDDLMIFFEATLSFLQGIKNVAKEFYSKLGLKVSYSKRELFCCSVSNENQHVLDDLLGLRRGRLPIRYLRVPLISGKMKEVDYRPLIDRITSSTKS